MEYIEYVPDYIRYDFYDAAGGCSIPVNRRLMKMNMFEKTTKAVKEAGKTVVDSAKGLGNSIYYTSKEQGELAGMKVQKSVIEKRLLNSYAEIGKKYVEYITRAQGVEAFDVSDIIEAMKPDLDKLEEIKSAAAEKEAAARKEEEERRQKKAWEEFEAKKAKLDKAFEMDILTQEEYDEKLSMAQKKLDNYDMLRKIEMQLQMGIISNDEYREKVENLLK